MPGKPGIFTSIVLLVLLGACSPESGGVAEELSGVHLEQIELPRGFEIEVVTDDVPGARSLAISPNGILYIGTRGEGVVYAVSGVLDRGEPVVSTVASNLTVPNGVAWRESSLYVAERTRILRFDEIDSQLEDPPSPTVVADGFPDEEVHGWRSIRFGPDGRLYVSVGSPCNVCESENPIFGSIIRLDDDMRGRDIFATGIRNTVGFDWHPETGELWFTDNGADRLGENEPPDELNRAPREGLHFGHPYCHGGDLPDPELGEGRSCNEFVEPAIQLGPHVAALGMRFYTAGMFPPDFQGHVFIAEHGSWNRPEPIGYRLAVVRLRGNQAIEYSTFAGGWLQGEAAWGRPVDVEVAPDGSLLVSDDRSGAIYRIRYQPRS